jgi:Protein of unknown function (DUF3574)
MHSFRLFGAGAFALLIMTMPALAQGLACLRNAHARDRCGVRPHIGGELGVTEQQWADFVAAEITPHFPQGLTIDDAVGQWRDPDKNTIVKNVTIVVPQNEPVEEKIAAIVAAYKQPFQHQSVGVVMRAACVSF